MKESYSEALARHAGSESYADRGNTVGVATAGVHAGPVWSSERFSSRVPTSFRWRKATRLGALAGKHPADATESKTWRMCGNFKRENREIPSVPRRRRRGRPANLTEGTAGMHTAGKSDDFIVPTTRANKAATAAAESAEERESPKGTVAHRHGRPGHRAGQGVTLMAKQRRQVANFIRDRLT